MDRRSFLGMSAGCLAGALTGSAAASEMLTDSASDVPVIDTHIHLYDTARPGGVPWPEPSDKAIYRPALPADFLKASAGLGVVGAIEIEASPLGSDNDWVLGVVEKNPVMVGMVGDLVPGAQEYMGELERLHRNQFFLGIRYGNLWNRNLAVDRKKDGFVDGLKELAKRGLVFESANPDGELIQALVAVANDVPDLRMVIDHLPHAKVPEDAEGRRQYFANLEELGRSPRVFIKLSEIPVLADGSLVKDLGRYTDGLDRLWGIFGVDKVMFGSDWPNSEHVAGYGDTFGIVKGYVAAKGRQAEGKFFGGNSVRAYRWRARSREQKAVVKG